MAKLLAKQCEIGDASRGSLSSYAYTLMVIHYLQQVKPPVIPVLQEVLKVFFNDIVVVTRLFIHVVLIVLCRSQLTVLIGKSTSSRDGTRGSLRMLKIW
jgi:hypothetical protein